MNKNLFYPEMHRGLTKQPALLLQILSPVTDNCPTWINGTAGIDFMTNFHVLMFCRTEESNPRPYEH